MNVPPPFIGIVVDDAADAHRGIIAVGQFFDDGVARFSRTDDHHRNGIVLILLPVLHAPEIAVGKAADEDKGDEQKGIEKIITLRNRNGMDLKKL